MDRSRLASRSDHSRPLPGAWLLLAVGLLFLMTAACGKKAPPRPPRAAEVAAVSDLALERDGDRVRLSWTVPDPAAQERIQLAGYVVLRGRQLEEDCEDCPIAFEPAAEIRLDADRPAGEPEGRMTYEETPAPGARYFYKVSAFSEGGRDLGTSNTVALD